MTVRIVHPATRDEWLEQRRAYIGASEYPALVGADPWRTCFEVFALKTGRIPPPKQTPAMLRGIELESTALAMVSRESGDLAIIHNVIGRILSKSSASRIEFFTIRTGFFFVDDEHRLCATPDAFAFRNGDEPRCGILEIKTIAPSRFREHWYDGDQIVVPDAARLQLNITAALAAQVMPISWSAVVALRVGYEIELDVIELPLPSPEFMRHVHESVAEFWRFVDNNELPPPDYGRDGKLISKIFPKDDGTHADFNGDAVLQEMLIERARLKADEKFVSTQLDRIDAVIRHRMGNAATATAGAWKISLKTYEMAGYTVEPRSQRRLSIRGTRGTR